MPSKAKRKTSNLQPQIQDAIKVQNQQKPNNECCIEGDRLFRFLHSLQREIESELQSNKILPEKFLFKQLFAVGINEVTRLLERMAPSSDDAAFAAAQKGYGGRPPCSSVTKLQAVLVASDCNSRWLTKHLASLASSRGVPIIYVKDNKEGSLRLGEVVKVKIAVALGVKVKGSSINQLLEEVLHDKSKELNAYTPQSWPLCLVSCMQIGDNLTLLNHVGDHGITHTSN